MFTLDAIHKIKKTKSKIKKELEESIAKSGRNENADIQEKVNRSRMNEGVVKAIKEFEQIIQNKKSDIVWLAYYQDYYKYFKNSERRKDLLAT